jgi:hypothetical protein
MDMMMMIMMMRDPLNNLRTKNEFPETSPPLQEEVFSLGCYTIEEIVCLSRNVGEELLFQLQSRKANISKAKK